MKTQDERYYLTTGKRTYSYDATAKRAVVYSRATGATVCDVTGVDLYVGNMLSNLADEMYQDGYQIGRKQALEELADKIERMQRS